MESKNSTRIEKKSLEAHVELCAERYASLDNKLDTLDKRMTTVEAHVVDIKESVSKNSGGMNKQLLGFAVTFIGIMFTAIITLLIHLASK